MTGHPYRSAERRCKAIDEWPDKDRNIWLAALRPGDVLEAGGKLSHRSASTICAYATGYGRWLNWLDCCGLLNEPTAPANRITPDRVRDYAQALAQYDATITIINRLEQLKQAAKVMEPRQNWSWIARIEASVRARHQPARPKRHRLVGIGVLFDLGVDLMKRADSESTGRRRFMAYRDGLLIALLAARPLRLRNLAALALGRNIVRRGGAWWIEIDAAETKTREPIEVPWPEALATHLEHYLSEFRPFPGTRGKHRPRPAEGALWLSTEGSPMICASIYDRVVARTRAAFGRPINPHLFRDCAATSVAIDDPVHVGIASQLLGHRGNSTTERHYNQARAVEASRQVQAFLISLRHSKAGE
jgi:integrase/recombinase XerD